MPIKKGQPIPAKQRIGSEDFKELFTQHGAREIIRRTGMTERKVYERRRAIELQEGIQLAPPTSGRPLFQKLDNHPAVNHLDIQNGCVLVGSDAHYWPGIVTTAHEAFVEFAREFKPKAIVLNGDAADFPTISRHAPLQWENRPTVKAEVENLKAMLSEIEKVSPKSRRIWPIGNHDARFEARLAQAAPEYAKIEGVHLKDHFPKWEPCMAAFINRDVVVRHRPVSGGIYAARNNTLRAGLTTIHGHLHSLKSWPHSDYRGVRWGVDCGTLADPYGPQFEIYTEMSPVDWRSGFVLLTFVKGELLQPEIALIRERGIVDWRGRFRRV